MFAQKSIKHFKLSINIGFKSTYKFIFEAGTILKQY